MRNRILLMILLAFAFQMSMAQQLSLDWVGQFTGSMLSMSHDIDLGGNVITVGNCSGGGDIDPSIMGVRITTGNGAYVTKQDSLGNVVWTGAIESPASTVQIWQVAVDGIGRIYVTGYLYGTADFDLTQGGIANYSSSGLEARFVARYGPSGFLHYVKVFPGYGLQQADNPLAVNAQGDVYMSGSFFGTVDLDPGVAVASYTSVNAWTDAYVVKLDPQGDFVWAKQFSGAKDDDWTSVCTSPSGDIYIAGRYSDSIDVDPGPGVVQLIANTFAGNFLCKLDANGNLLWGTQFLGSGYCFASAIETTPTGDIVVVGGFAGGTMDFDPSPGGAQTFSASNVQGFLVKLDGAGNYIWARAMDADFYSQISALDVNGLGEVYYAANIAGDCDVDLGIGVNMHLQMGSMISKLDVNGNYVWAGFQTIYGGHQIEDLAAFPTGNVVGGGNFYNAFQAAPLPPNQWLAGVAGSVFKWLEGPCASVVMTLDSVRNIGCGTQGYAAVQMSNGTPPYSYQWSTTPISNLQAIVLDSTGYYQVTATDAAGCTDVRSLIMEAPVSQTAYDLKGYIFASHFRQGVSQTMQIEALNDGCLSTNADLSLTLDSQLTFLSSNPSPTSISGQTISWNLGSIDYFSPHFLSDVTVVLDTNATGNLVCSDLLILPQSMDFNPSNNAFHDCESIVGAFDPNDIRVFPQGACNSNYITSDQTLTYFIRFQNVGTADAINIRVQALLSPYLDVNTLHLVGSSHSPRRTEIGLAGSLNFIFDNIHLPDSTTDEAGSHGYVIFEIKPLAQLPVGTGIGTGAAIYFDYNAPVLTNVVSNTITSSINSPNTAVTYITNGLQASAANASYQWLDCDNGNAPISGETNQTIALFNTGHYAVIVTEGACSDTSDCFAYPFVVGQAEPDPMSLLMRAYPNPNQTGLLHVDLFQTEKDLTAQILDVLGRIVGEGTYRNTGSIALQLPAQAGIYYVRLRSATGASATLKVVRE
ncbi:MAG: T9SS type A sorting domain-containing protein [Bacteroidetes bacterium]|nr:T9SS type A sorting domain-containing protein [Bacteroidota bacterium]